MTRYIKDGRLDSQSVLSINWRENIDAKVKKYVEMLARIDFVHIMEHFVNLRSFTDGYWLVIALDWDDVNDCLCRGYIYEQHLILCERHESTTVISVDELVDFIALLTVTSVRKHPDNEEQYTQLYVEFCNAVEQNRNAISKETNEEGNP